MQIQVLISFDNSKEDRRKLARILDEYSDQTVSVVKGKRGSVPSNEAMVEELTPQQIKLLDIAERKAHEDGETPMADSLGMNRSDIIRELVRSQQGELTIPQIGSLLYASYPEVDRKRWMQSAHTMATARQPCYCLRKDSSGRVTLFR